MLIDDIATLLKRKQQIDAQTQQQVNRLAGGVYDAWAIDALEMLLRIAMGMQLQQSSGHTSPPGQM